MTADKAKKPKKAAKAEKPQEPEVVPVPRLQEKYVKEILPGLAEKFGRANRMSLPRLEKIVINMGWARPSPKKNTWRKPSRR